MFLALPLRPSFVETATTIGLLFLRWDFAAKHTAVSDIPFANLDMEFPVHGAIKKRHNVL